jgi:putative SOS response-associated peptidase YedK
MCKKYVLASDPERIQSRFNVRLDPSFEAISKMYAVSSGNYSYVITRENTNQLEVQRFGMTPFFSKGQMNIINARSEGDKNSINDPEYTGSKSIFLKTAFIKPMQVQRCLVIADAYYEWSDRKKPYLVYLQNRNRPFAFAGIYDHWQNPVSKEIVTSFAIITTVANSLLQSIGVKRMPVVLARVNEMEWIKPSNHLSDVLRLLEPCPSEYMNCYPVSVLVNVAGANDPSMLNPMGEKLLSETVPVRISGGYRTHKEKHPANAPTIEERLVGYVRKTE